MIRRGWPENLALALGLLGLAVLVLMPFWWVASSSIKLPREIIARQPTMLPHSFTLGHFRKLLGSSDFPQYLLNSVLVSSASMAITVGLAIFASYAFFRMSFRGQGALYRLILVAYAFPAIVVLIPLYGMMSRAGLIDTLAALVVVNVALALPFAIWMMRSFLSAIPVEIEDAARIDGASHLTLLFRIIVPLAAPGIASIAIFAFISSWTEYLFASVLIQSDAKRTIPAGLAGIIGQYQVDWGLMLAGATMAVLPVVVLFALIGRYFVSGLTEGAVK